MANLYTKTGDKGETSLYGGQRISKNSIKVICYGTMDEANSMLGLAYSKSENENVRKHINKIQKRIFSLGAELASDEKGLEMLQGKISEVDIKYLETIVDECTEIVGKQTHFVVPGVNEVSATLHVARTIVRRAERNIVSLSEVEQVREEIAKYVNRLSDTIYALARLEEFNFQVKEVKNLVLKELKKKVSFDLNEKKEESNLEGVIKMGENTTVELNLQVAKKMAEFAEEKANEINVPMVISIVDNGGNVILVHRMEDSLLASIDISLNKAYTAVSLKMPTDNLKDLSKPGDSLYGVQNTNNNRIVIFGGGIPFKYRGKVVGAIGVSGGSVEEDMCVAKYAMEKIMK